jgi:peptidoglycan/xylan/chitin deacetylase (PgdA/CDA1 family)
MHPSDPIERAVANTKGVRALDYEIATWYGGRRAACSLTFDDGTLDQYLLAFPELESRELAATFFLITGPRQEGRWNDNGTTRQLFSWDHARQMDRAGQEIASHSHTHQDLSIKGAPVDEELLESLETLRGQVPVTEGVVFGWPFWRSTRSARRQARRYYIGARTGGGFVESYLGGPGIPGPTPADLYGVNSLGALLSADDRDWIRALEQTVLEGGWLVAGFHGVDDGWIGDRALGWQAMPIDRFRRILDYLAAREDLWIAPFGQVVRYIRERDGARLRLLEETEEKMVLSLTDRLDGLVYNQPLTIELVLPETWRFAQVSQEGMMSQSVAAVDGRIVFHALPSGLPILLRRAQLRLPFLDQQSRVP